MNHCSAGSIDFKDTGVKKLFILAIASDVEENYSNMLLMLNKLNLTSPDNLHYPVRFSNDLKMNNILVGIMNHSSAHPCCWCDVLKGDLIECGNMRTIRNIQSDYEKWCKSGKNFKNAKLFNNFVNEPIFRANNDTRILELIPPPELHLLLGIVNLLFKHLEDELPELADDWRMFCGIRKRFFMEDTLMVMLVEKYSKRLTS